MMKKRLLSLCTAALCSAGIISALLTGCKWEKPQHDKISIVTTAFPPYDFTRAVTGSSAELTMLLSTGAEAHSYEPTPLDIAKIQQCDVFVYIGGEGEVWVDKILDSIDTSDITVVCLFDYVDALEEEEVEGASPTGHSHEHHHDHDHDDDEHEHHHDDDDEEEEFDEHIWTSPQNAIKCINGIETALSQKYPEKSDDFKENAADYCDKLDALDHDFHEMTENAPGNIIVVGDRFPFRYLAHDYGLKYYAAFSGCSAESEPSVYTMAFLIDEILEHDLDTVFCLEFSTKKLAEKLCDATGAHMLTLHSCHNVSKEDFENGVTYIDLMRMNYNNLREALY